MDIIPARRKHSGLIREAFAEERNFRRDRHVDYLAQPGISDFHCHRILRSLRSHNPEVSHYLFLENGSVKSFASIKPCVWHSRHFGCKYFKIQPLFFFTADETSLEAAAKSLLEAMKKRDGDVYVTRIEAHNAALSYKMIENGFIHAGSSIRMSLRLSAPSVSVDKKIKQKYDTLIIRDFKGRDLPIIEEIGQKNHVHSHFFCEIRFPRSRASDLFAEWIRQCAGGMAQKVYIAELGGEIAGFATLLTTSSLMPYINKRIGVIDFIVVDRRFQGQGVGRALLQAAFSWFEDRVDIIELRTMADNLQAIRFYENNGFRILSADHHLHYWT